MEAYHQTHEHLSKKIDHRRAALCPGWPAQVHPKHEVEERWPSHQQVSAREGAQATATTFSSEPPPLEQGHVREVPHTPVEEKFHPYQVRDHAPGSHEKPPSASGLLGTWKQRDVSEKSQQVSGRYERLSEKAFELDGPHRRKERFRIAHVLARHDSWTDRSQRMRECCSKWRQVRASRSHPEKSRPIPSIHCRDRLCPECRRARAGRVARKIRPVMETATAAGSRPILITLTQVDIEGESLERAMKRLNESWAKLIRSKAWKSHVSAAINFRESTYNREKNWWHAHSHVLVLIRGDFWDRDELIALWGKCSAGAWNVDIKYATPGVEAELAQYGMKAVDLDDDQILAYAIAMKGVRLISSTGEWKGVLSDQDVDVDEAEDDEVDISFQELVEMRAAGDVWATAVLTAVDHWIEARMSLPWPP